MRSAFLNCVAKFVLAGTFTPAFAATPPPAVSPGLLPHEATLRLAPSRGITMGSLPVRFEKTSLDEILNATRAGALAHQGDAGASVYWLCYTNLNDTVAERIWIISDGEMGGDRHLVTGVSAQRLPDGRASAECPALPANRKPIALEHGVWLATSPRTVRRKLGAPSFKNAAWESYDYAAKVPGRCAPGGFDLTSSLLLRIEQGRIHFLRIGHVTSC